MEKKSLSHQRVRSILAKGDEEKGGREVDDLGHES